MGNNSQSVKQANLIGSSSNILNSSMNLPQKMSLQVLSQNMTGFDTNNTTMNKLEQSKHSQIQVVFIKRQRERQNQQKIALKWKERIKTFVNQMRDKLKLANVREQTIQLTILFFLQRKHSKLQVKPKYKEIVQPFKTAFQKILQEKEQEETQCIPILQIIQNKQYGSIQKMDCCLSQNFIPSLFKQKNIQNGSIRSSQLKTIHIQYQKRVTFDEEKMCSISAIQFFKVIHENKMLAEVTLKGVQVLSFQQLLRIIYYTADTQTSIDDDYKWIKDFSPSKQLKLSICAQVSFEKQNYDKEQILSQISYLAYFCQLFCQLSCLVISAVNNQTFIYQQIIEYIFMLIRIQRLFDQSRKEKVNQIKAKVYLPCFWYYQIKDNQNQNDYDPDQQQEILVDDLSILHQLWKCLQGIEKLKLFISYQSEEFEQFSYVRSMVFGGLASFTKISQLSLQRFTFSDDICTNDFLAIEKSLTTFFKNNKVTHLELRNCRNFPTLPKITTLQSIYLQSIMFKQQFNFMRSVIKTNPSLRSIVCFSIQQQALIDEQLFNRLQTLILRECNKIDIEFTSQSSSKLQHLNIQIVNQESALILSKLTQIICLVLNGNNIQHTHLQRIPSLYLQELHIYNNNTFTSFDLQMISKKWPFLSILSFYNCRSLIIDVQTIFKFKRLKMLKLDANILREKKKDLIQILNLGIQVEICSY